MSRRDGILVADGSTVADFSFSIIVSSKSSSASNSLSVGDRDIASSSNHPF